MAIKAGRVGVREDQVDHYGRLKPTQWLIEQLRDILDTDAAEVTALRLAREELARLGLDEPIIQKPIVTPVVDPESFHMETEEDDNASESE